MTQAIPTSGTDLVPDPDLNPDSKTPTQAILETLARAVLVYGRRNARILYDALGTLAEAVHGALAEPMFLTLIMPPLVQKWQARTMSSLAHPFREEPPRRAPCRSWSACGQRLRVCGFSPCFTRWYAVCRRWQTQTVSCCRCSSVS